MSNERMQQLNFNAKRDSDIKQIAQYDTEKRINANAFRAYDPTGISPTLNTMQGGNLEPCVRVKGVADRIEKRQNGRRFKEDGEPMFTLTSQDRHGEFETKDEPKAIIGSTQKNAYVGNGSTSPSLTSAMGQGGGHVPMPVYSNLRIRKLTPLECWRLQGFTDEQFYKD